jgi:hypothetical protein
MIVAFTGGRDFRGGRSILRRVLISQMNPEIDQVVVGDCQTGVDRDVVAVARALKFTVTVYTAEWKRHVGCRCRDKSRPCKFAGPRRNRSMLEGNGSGKRAGLLVALPGGPGTANCIATARELGIPVREVKP